MKSEFLSVELIGSVALITFDRPPVNAVSQQMYEDIRALFGRFDELVPDAKAVVLHGAGRHFCAGNDLDEFATLDEINAAGRMRVVRDAFASIYDCPVPVVGAVHGAALGTGLAIAACCDMVVAADTARFGTPEVGVGVMGGARHLARLVPAPILRQMYFTADPLPVSALVGFGSVIDVVPEKELVDRAMAVAARIARHSRAALREAKATLNTIESMDLKSGYELEQRATGRLVAHPDAKEALQAVRDGRPPRYVDDVRERVNEH